MADENPTTSGRRSRSAGQRGRDQIARLVVVSSFLIVFLLIATLIALAKFKAADAVSSAAEKAFNAILPVLAGWVGTVLAFYFSSASQEHTNDILDKAMERAAGRPVDGTLVSAKMILVSKILGLQKLEVTKPSTLGLTALRALFSGKLTRLMFLENGAFKYLLHVGTLDKFLTKAPANPAATFEDLLKDSDIVTEISKLVVFVPFESTLAEAKAALDKVAGAQDIIVTATGNPTEPVIGWLTNNDLTKALVVS
jgi:hypothetical protein